MAKLKSTLTIGIEPSENADGAWQFQVTVPPLAVIEDLRSLLGIDQYSGLMTAALQSPEAKALVGKADITREDIKALIFGNASIDVSAISEVKIDKRKIAEIILPFCGAPMGLDDVPTWQALLASHEVYGLSLLCVAAKAVFDRCESDPVAMEKKISFRP